MSDDDSDSQLPLFIDTPQGRQRVYKLNRRAAKARKAAQPELISDGSFGALGGVPATRADCPAERPCPRVRCRWHLLQESAEHRAGRPGLSSVPRDERGLTLPIKGAAGDERPGTTLRPSWLKVRGLEIEREVRVWIWTGSDGVELHESRAGTLDYWLARLHVGEPVLVFDDETSEVMARAELTQDGRLKLDRALPESTFTAVLTRVREVSSCALDEIDRRGKMTNEQVGDGIGRHRTLVAREVRRALGKAIGIGEEMGIAREDLMAALMAMGDE